MNINMTKHMSKYWISQLHIKIDRNTDMVFNPDLIYRALVGVYLNGKV